MKIKKILFLYDSSFRENGGPGINEYSFVKEASRILGPENIVAFGRDGEHLPCQFHPLKGKSNLSLSYFWGAWQNYKAFRKEAAKHKDYIIVIRIVGFSMPAFFVALSGMSYVIKTTYGTIDRHNCFKIYQKIIRWFFVTTHRYIFDHAMAIDMSTIECANIYKRETGRTNCIVIPNGYDQDMFFLDKTQKKPSSLVLGIFGSFPFIQGGKEIAMAIHLLQKKYPDISGLVIGDNGEANKVRDYARSLGVLDRIDILGERPYTEMPQYARRMTVGFVLEGVNRRMVDLYGLSGQKTPQYLACGVPVVTRPINPIFGLDGGDALGAAVCDDTTENLIAAVERCIELSRDPKTAERCAQFAQKHFSNKMLTERRLQFWQRVLDEQETTRGSSEN